MAKCCICNREVEREDATILAMGGSGKARVLCDECEEHLEIATKGRDFEQISEAIGEIGRKMGNGNPDEITYTIVSELILNASERAKQIKEGTYDFSVDDVAEEDELDEIPEELLESEEDKEKDRLDEEKMKKFDKIYNIILTIALIACAGVIIWKLVERFLLK